MLTKHKKEKVLRGQFVCSNNGVLSIGKVYMKQNKDNYCMSTAGVEKNKIKINQRRERVNEFSLNCIANAKHKSKQKLYECQASGERC